MRKWLVSAYCLGLLLTGAFAQPFRSPEEFLGFPVGGDRHLADWQQIHDYFQELDRSPRILVETLGRTTEDRPFLLVIISAPETLAELNRYRELQDLLADPRKVPVPVETLVQDGKAVVLVTCSIHSTEVAAAQMSMELAWDLAVSTDKGTQEILRNVILLMVPSLNPDGIDHVNHWYGETLGTNAEGTPPPRLYHRYTGHDNNRDWFMFTQEETRLTVSRIHNEWHPQIVIDLHQMGTHGARIFVPPFMEPIDQNVDPILQAQIVDLGGFLFSSLIARGRKGIVTHAIYDAYSPARAYCHYHGGVRILTESASANLASPVEIPFQELREGLNYDPQRSSWNFPVVWGGGRWTLRDIVDDQKTAVRAALEHAALHRVRWLRNFHQVAQNAVRRSSPFAFLIPPEKEQRDQQAVVDLLTTLEFAAVEIHVAEQPFITPSIGVAPPWSEATRNDFPGGTYIVYMGQPNSAFAKTMLEIQEYPRLNSNPGGPMRKPYDVTAQTLGLLLGTAVYQADSPFEVGAAQVTDIRGRSVLALEGQGNYWLLSHENNGSFRAVNRMLAKGHNVYWAPNGFLIRDRGFPVGTFLVQVRDHAEETRGLIEDLPISVTRAHRRPQLAWQRIRLPRVALYGGHAPSMDEGWTRWVLEQYEFPYTRLPDRAVREEDLSDFDVIVFASTAPNLLRNGLSEPYPEEYRGGIGVDGLARLREYCEKGGTLLFLGESTHLPVEEWDLGVRNLTRQAPPEEFFIPGTLLRAEVDDRHPIGYGAGTKTALMFVQSHAFASTRGLPVVRYAEESVRLSGWANGEDRIAGKPALLDVGLKKGRVILVGFRTQFRAQARSGYKFLFNSLYYSTLRR